MDRISSILLVDIIMSGLEVQHIHIYKKEEGKYGEWLRKWRKWNPFDNEGRA